MKKSDFPNCEKLAKVSDEVAAIMSFLFEDSGVSPATYKTYTKQTFSLDVFGEKGERETEVTDLVCLTEGEVHRKVLAFYDIDPEELEKERRQILEEASNGS